MKLKRPLYGPGHPQGPSDGLDVRAFKRMALRYARRRLHDNDVVLVNNNDYGAALEGLVARIQRHEGIMDSGDIGRLTSLVLFPEADALARSWYGKYTVPSTENIEPDQGWGSLDRSLWEAYSEGRRRDFIDLGTYVNKPGDHGGSPTRRGPPAFAFDLGRADRFLMKGWGYLKARKLAQWYVQNANRLRIEYVILGMRIWNREKGWHAYGGDRSHMFHIHVSGLV